jgi:putative permease
MAQTNLKLQSQLAGSASMGAYSAGRSLSSAITRAVVLLALLTAGLWFIEAALGAVLFALLAIVLALALNAPVSRLERRGLSRWQALACVLLALGLLLILLGWLVVPRFIAEAGNLAESAPLLVEGVEAQINGVLARYPAVSTRLNLDQDMLWDMVPNLQSALLRVGRYTVGLLSLLVYLLLLLSTVAYMVALPHGLLRGYLSLFPPALRDRATEAFTRGSSQVSSWVYSNAVVGALEAVAAAIVLPLLGVPGALVWAALTFFGELIPKVGPFVVAIPPILAALAVSTEAALWTLLFYVVVLSVIDAVVTPYVRGRTMRLHPASVIFAVLALGSAFGLIGALVATPLCGMVKAYWEVFWLSRHEAVEERDPRINTMLGAPAERA